MVSFEPMQTDASAAPRVASCTLRKNPPVGDAVLEVVLDELTAEQMYSFRIWAVNAVGKGSTAAMCSFATAGRPGLPKDLAVLSRGVQSLDIARSSTRRTRPLPPGPQSRFRATPTRLRRAARS